VKLHPCCYATHTAIDAALELRPAIAAAAGDVADEVTGVEVVARPGGLAPLIHHRPADGLQAKFSLEYAVAAALLDGHVRVASFTDERVQRADVQQLLRRVEVTAADVPPTGPSAWGSAFPAVVTVRRRNGEALTRRADHAAGHATRPVTDEQLRAKFADCLAAAGIPAAGEAYDGLRHLRHLASAKAVVDVLAGLRSTP
jgi:2-methylcitrate dehydratase PrpD